MLFFLLLYLPFHEQAVKHSSGFLLYAARFVDETVLVLAFPVAVAVRWRHPRPWRNADGLALLAVGGIIAACLISAAVNRGPLVASALGTFDYAKAPLFLVIGSTLCADRVWFQRTYRAVLIVALIAALCAVSQEASWLLRDKAEVRRLGLYRARGFLCSPSLLGVYLLFYFLVEATRARRASLKVALLYGGLALSISRVANCAAAGLGSFLVRRRPWMIAPVVISLAIAVALSDWTVRELELHPSGGGVAGAPGMGRYAPQEGAPGSPDGSEPHVSFRTYAAAKAMEIWHEHKLVGAGPGRFGGVVSLMTGSPLYQEHPWSPRQFHLLTITRSLDEFPGQVLAELGILGAVSFAAFFVVMCLALWRTRLTGIVEEGDMARGLLLAFLVVPFYCLGSGVNQAFYLVTFYSLAGALLGLSAVEGDRSGA